MNASLRALLSGVVDYAGLFPPAGLPLDQAIRNYARYRQGPDSWILGRFVIPAARLPDAEPFVGLFRVESPLRLSLLGRGETDLVRFVNAVATDCAEGAAFCRRLAGRVTVDVYEDRLPADYSFRTVALLADQLGPAKWMLFFEGPGAADGTGSLPAALSKALAIKARPENTRPVASCGLKLRTGGLDASAFPTVDLVAFVLRASRAVGVPLKFTAGLHHPIRRFDDSVQTHVHGFINVFVAGVLAHARRLDAAALEAVIAEEDPAHFVFTDEGLAWKDRHASTEEIAAARRDFVTSFGSCSFDEPRDDLRALGWL